ncbi:MAG: DUF4143 domain-containing protein [Acidobacteria bacterium]|nr:DUF4143 domain-containing protein [Acidobacteriota bacterium]
MPSTYRRLLDVPAQSFFLFGMRGVGKSTWARAALPDAVYLDLLDERLHLDLLADPGLFYQSVAERPPGTWVVVDEVQRLPALLNEIHRCIATLRLRFALLGSSARKLKAAGTNLLAGRALRKSMFPLTAAELGADFDLDRVLRHGSIPLVWTSDAPDEVLGAYAQLYLREEIRAEALVRNLPGFVRFLPVAALFNGQVINVAGIARDAGVARTTVQGYLDILEDTLLVYRLPAYEARARVRERRLPKLYWVDPGVVRATKRHLGALSAEERGPLFESWVLTTLRAHAETQEHFEEIGYWSPHQTRTEVDFLLRRGRERLAIEVKAASRYHTGLLAGLRALGARPDVARRLLVYTGPRSFRSEDGIDVWPAQRFASAVASGELWP